MIVFDALEGVQPDGLLGLLRRRYIRHNHYWWDLLEVLSRRDDVEILELEPNVIGPNALLPGSFVVGGSGRGGFMTEYEKQADELQELLVGSASRARCGRLACGPSRELRRSRRGGPASWMPLARPSPISMWSGTSRRAVKARNLAELSGRSTKRVAGRR